MKKKAPANNQALKTEFFAYRVPGDNTVRYGWYTPNEFKSAGFIKVDLGSFNKPEHE